MPPGPAGPFGRARLCHWHLDPAGVFLNNGSYGATPKAVLAAQSRWRRRLERQPVRFMTETLGEALADATDRIAAFLGADPAGLAFSANATEAVNSVLWSLDLGAGDTVVVTDQAYRGVAHALEHVVKRRGARLHRIALPFPACSREQIIERFARDLPPTARLAVFDHVVSATAMVMPVAALVALCRERGIPVLIDGAHAPGMLDLDLGRLAPDWYAANLHKWAYAPKGCGLLWTAARYRDRTHPAVISTEYGKGYRAEFGWMGTRDPSPWLSAPAGIDFFDRMGGARARAYMTGLAAQAAALLVEALGTGHAAAPGLTAAMATVRLPDSLAAVPDLNRRLRHRHGIEVPILPIGAHRWIRISTQVFNEIADITALITALNRESARA